MRSALTVLRTPFRPHRPMQRPRNSPEGRGSVGSTRRTNCASTSRSAAATARCPRTASPSGAWRADETPGRHHDACPPPTQRTPMNPPMPNPDMLLFHVAHDEVSQAVAQFCAGLQSAALGDFATARFAAQLADIGANRALALFALRGHIITILGTADFEERRAALDMLALSL